MRPMHYTCKRLRTEIFAWQFFYKNREIFAKILYAVRDFLCFKRFITVHTFSDFPDLFPAPANAFYIAAKESFSALYLLQVAKCYCLVLHNNCSTQTASSLLQNGKILYSLSPPYR